MALGIFEGGNFPASIKAVTEWFPIKERALCTGIFNSGTTIGAVVCPLIVPAINHRFGWAMAFYITGALGIAWLILWVLTYDSPDRHPMLSAQERAYIEADRSIPTSPVPPSVSEKDGVVTYAPITQEGAPIPWLRLLGFRATWAYVIGMGLTSPVWWFYLFWIPDFLQKRFGLSQDDVGAPVAIIYLMTLVGSVGGGWLPSLLLARGFSLNASRKISLLLPALCTLAVAMVPIVPTVAWAVLFVGFAASAHQAWSANL
jgi:ACS family hexuronate transporter-like MFS transporter